MRILITGSNGLVGKALVPRLTEQGHLVTKLVRAKPVPGEHAVQWDPSAGVIDGTALDGMDAVIHLAGESLRGRWSTDKKARILDSRVKGTRLLAEALASCTKPPRVFITASAIGYYGDRKDEVLCECAAPGNDFLAQVVRQWEEAARPAAAAGNRVVQLRFGVILSKAGGVLTEVLPLFRKGLGGRLG
ncbi:MAG TPA: NAD-dependent epimerase/dehydratase family protein, partial [Armatimonadota bacterium]|nr:NAD-dependent epimerase/dehydratase family protein [Armatimonadota bacterium]